MIFKYLTVRNFVEAVIAEDTPIDEEELLREAEEKVSLYAIKAQSVFEMSNFKFCVIFFTISDSQKKSSGTRQNLTREIHFGSRHPKDFAYLLALGRNSFFITF